MAFDRQTKMISIKNSLKIVVAKFQMHKMKTMFALQMFPVSMVALLMVALPMVALTMAVLELTKKVEKRF